MKPHPISWLAGAMVVMALPLGALAQTDSLAVPPAGFEQPVASDALGSLRGGSELVHNDMSLAGVTSGNSATHVFSGNNQITAGAFAGASGLPVVIQNTGSNVLIQNATILNLRMN